MSCVLILNGHVEVNYCKDILLPYPGEIMSLTVIDHPSLSNERARKAPRHILVGSSQLKRLEYYCRFRNS